MNTSPLDQNILGVMTKSEFDKHALIMPPDKDLHDFDKRTTRIVVDSLFRDPQYKNQNDYYFIFDDDINDVVSAKLLCIDIPFSSYLINGFFNSIYVSFDGTTEVVVGLTEGNYDKAGLASMMQTRLNAVIANKQFTVTYSTLLDKFEFGANQSFYLMFAGKKNSLEDLLGFRKQNYESVNNTITAPFRCNFDFNNYMVMCIDQFDANKSNNKPLNKSFAVINKTFSDLNTYTDIDIVKSFNPPLARLAKIHVTFFDRYGNPYDFQNMDHRFEIMLQSLKQRRKYHGIFQYK